MWKLFFGKWEESRNDLSDSLLSRRPLRIAQPPRAGNEVYRSANSPDRTAHGQDLPWQALLTETFLIDLAKHLKLPGFGENAIQGNDGTMHPIERGEEF